LFFGRSVSATAENVFGKRAGQKVLKAKLRHYCPPKKDSLRDNAVFLVAVSKHGSRMRDKGKGLGPLLTEVQVHLTNKIK
jgi:hypothetical protein